MNSPKVEAFTDTSERKTTLEEVQVGSLTFSQLELLRKNSQMIYETLRAHGDRGITIDLQVFFAVVQGALENIILDNVENKSTEHSLELNKIIVETLQKLLESAAPGAVSALETGMKEAIKISLAARPIISQATQDRRSLQPMKPLDETTAQRMLKKIPAPRQDNSSDSTIIFENNAAA